MRCPLTEFPEPTKSHEKGVLKRKVDSVVSNSGADIDSTISAFLARRMQADSSTFSALVTASQLAVEVEDLSPKTKQKGSKKVKLRAGVDDTTHAIPQKPSASGVEIPETNSAEGRIVRKVTHKTSSKSGRPSTERNDFERNTPVVTVANVVETLENSRDPNSERRFASSESPETDLGSKLGPAQQSSRYVSLTNREHPLTDDPDVQEAFESIEERPAQIEKNPGHVSPTAFVRQKVRSTPSDSNRDSSDSETSGPTSTPTTDSKGISNTGAQLTIPKGIEISEVPVEAHGEGSSDESSTEGDAEWGGLTGAITGFVNAPPLSVHPIADQLTALIRGTVKRGPRASILDEIPSSSETGSESSAEDLVLDEEEDLSRQPSHRQSKTLSKTRAHSSEPEQTSEGEDDASMPVYLDTSHEVPDRPETLLAIGETGDHVSTSVEVEASKRPEGDTYPVGTPEAQNQDRSIRPPIAPREDDATAPSSQSSTPTPRPTSPESDATAINTEPAKSPIHASDQADGVLVPTSSSVIDETAANTKEMSQLQMNDDVESAVKLPGGGEESDPIEPEPTQPRSGRSIGPTPRAPRRRAPSGVLKPPPISELPSRRSGRLANRRSSAGTSEATLVPLSQVRRKMTEALETSIAIAQEENRRIRDDAEEVNQEKSSRKPAEKSRKRPITQHSGESGHETSPSVAREDGSPRAPNSSQPRFLREASSRC
ncbi:hypothetical protein BC827DRAFT_342809 [Russula dissimulans]|nr:hypothetical protein BC827DRAFT_342809 [Russula dissimulans]